MITVITLGDVLNACQEAVYDGAHFMHAGGEREAGWTMASAKHTCDVHHTFQTCLPAE